MAPSRKNRFDWYGAYDFTHGQCLIWHQDNCDSDTTVAFLHHLATWNPDPDQQTMIIWDRASWHSKAAIVRQAAEVLGFWLIDLPSYSPDLNPIEGLWKWMPEELTQHHDPDAIITRFWPKFELDPAYEKVLFSF